MRRVLLGLLAVCLLALSACGGGAPQPDYEINDAEPRRISPQPYERTAETVIDLDDPDRPVDANGVAHWEIPWERGTRWYHPVDLARYGLYLVESYRVTGAQEYLDRAVANADHLLDGSVDIEGARWFPYPFDHSLNSDEEGMVLLAPWYSGMAQGQALSLLVRLHQETGDDRWMDAADETFETFHARPGDGPWFAHVPEGNLWFEEFVADSIQTTQVVNGHMYEMFGLYDYVVATEDPHAAQLFDGGAATMIATFDHYRVADGISYYCAAQYCRDESWQPDSYHRGVANQFDSLALMTGDGRFVEMAQTFRSDYAASGATG